jgi:PAS domain S-box-containing protein
MTTNTSSTPSIYEDSSNVGEREALMGAASSPYIVEGVSPELVYVLQQIVDHAGALLEVNKCSLALLDAKGSELVTLATLHKTGSTPRNTRFQMNEGVAGWVAGHREALIIDDVSADLRFKRLGRAPVGSMACVPLMDKGIFIGTLTVSSLERDVFDTRKQHMLIIFAEQAVLAITNARQAEVAQRQANQLEMLMKLSQGITTRREVEDLYRTILIHVHRLVPSEQSVIYSYYEQQQELRPVAEIAATLSQNGEEPRGEFTVNVGNVQGEKAEAVWLNHSSSLAAWAATHRHPMIHSPVKFQQDESCVPVEGAALAELAAPLVSKDMLYGVLALRRAEAFTSEELRLVRNLSDMAAAALENAALFQRVRADREQWRAIWEASSDGIALVGADACFIEANPAFGHIFGQEPQQISGVDFLELLGCTDEGAQAECPELSAIALALQEQKALPYIETDLLIKGVSRGIGLSVTPVKTAHAPFSLVIARDITPIRDATRMKANFLSMITHELRSPINAINGYLDLALTGIAGELNEQQREFVQRARGGSEHLYALVEDLLLVSRADAGQLRLNRSVLRLPEIVSNSIEEMELTARDGQITLDVAIPDDLPRLYADGVRLQQVLRNLLSNALHYTQPGGNVSIAAHIVDLPIATNDSKPHASTSEENQEAQEIQQAISISISDTGSGIAEEYQARIFERFYQIPLDSTGRASGQGLGLAIVKMIVELHGGSVTVRSKPGEGSTFTFTIPGVLS